MIFHLVYVSEKSQHFRHEDVDNIIASSQKNNGNAKVTGLLINNGEYFIQLLEGKKDDVMKTFNRICADHRHFRVKILYSASSSSRLFPEWAMGLVREPTESTMNQILPFLHNEIQGHEQVKAKVHAALKSFNGSSLGKRAS